MGLALARMILRVMDGEISDATAADWSDLPLDLLFAVSANLQTLADYVRFRAVCQSWRAAAPVIPRHLPREFPWLMFPLSGASNLRGFFNPLTEELHRTTLPEDSLRCRRVGSSFGWLILTDESPSIFLVNPLTRRRIDLPPLTSFPMEIRDDFIEKVILFHSPNSKSDFVAFAILNIPGGHAYCKNGDGSWKVLDAVHRPSEDYGKLGGDHDVGVYNLADETIESFPSYPRSSHEPIWITPNLC